MPKIWLYDDDNNKVLTPDSSDPRLVLGWRNAPNGKCVWFKFRAHESMDSLHQNKLGRRETSARNGWRYLYYGNTETELYERVNATILSTIDGCKSRIRLEGQNIERLRASLLKPSEKKRMEG